jgi:sugar phosphate isomerase/epimerase
MPEQVKDNQRLLPGEGVIDLTGFLHALRQIGYNDGVSVEVFGRGLKEMPPEEGARLGFEYASRVMRGAGVLSPESPRTADTLHAAAPRPAP